MNLSFYISHHLSDLDWISVVAFDRRSQTALIDAHSASKFSDRYSFALINSVDVLASVGLLLRERGPSAITGRVWSIIINAVKRSSIWTRTHVCEETSVVKSPLWSHVDSSRSVEWKLRIPLVVATILSVFPRFIFRSLSTRVSVAGVLFNGCFSLVTAAATRAATTKTPRLNRSQLSAVALAVPSSTTNPVAFHVGRSPRQNDQLAEALSGSIYQFGDRRVSLSMSLWASIIRLTSSATEIPRRFASFFRYAICGTVNEIICLIMFSGLSSDVQETPLRFAIRVNKRVHNVSTPAVGLHSGAVPYALLPFKGLFAQIFDVKRLCVRRGRLRLFHTLSIPQGITGCPGSPVGSP